MGYNRQEKTMRTKLLLLVISLIPLVAAANPKDFEKIQLKAQTGDAKACFKLAEYYYQGTDGLEANMDSAAYYYGKAADAGNKNAIPLAGLTNRALYKKTKDKAKLNLSIKYFSVSALLYLFKREKVCYNKKNKFSLGSFLWIILSLFQNFSRPATSRRRSINW